MFIRSGPPARSTLMPVDGAGGIKTRPGKKFIEWTRIDGQVPARSIISFNLSEVKAR
jgi:hypothetical protein